MTSDAASKQAQGGGDIFSLRNANTAPMRILRSVFILALFFLVFVIGVPSDEEDGIDRSSSFGARFTVTDATTRHHQMPKMMARSAAVSSSPTGGAEVETSSLSFSNVNEQMTKSLQNLESKTYATSRMLVKSGRMRLEASNVEDTVKKITDILNEYPEGFIESKTQSDNYAKSIHITARVPSEHFEDILESFQEAVGKENVKSISSNAHDITDQYVDAASRSDVLQASRLALQTLLEKAQSVKDVMEVQRELNRVVEQFESQKKIAESLKTQSVRNLRVD